MQRQRYTQEILRIEMVTPSWGCLTALFTSASTLNWWLSSGKSVTFVVVAQLLSHVLLFLTPWIEAHQAFSVLHYLLEFSQTHVHWVSDAIQQSHPLLPPTPLALILSQHQNLFQWDGFLQQVAKILELQLQHQSFQWILRLAFLYDRLVWSPCSPGDSQECSPAPQYKSISSWGFSFL